MPIQPKVSFIAVPSPRAFSASQLRLSVVVVPRLVATTPAERQLSDWDFPVNWVTKLGQLASKIKVKWDGGSPLAVTLADYPRDFALWDTIFPQARRVVPFVYEDHSKRPRVPFPATALDTAVKSTYGTFAAGGLLGLPPVGSKEIGDGVRGPTDLDKVVRDISSGRDLLDKAYKPGEPVWRSGSAPISDPKFLHYFCQRFYQRRPVGSAATDLPDDQFDGNFEFHELITVLGDHPTLLRRLGLVFDLVIPASSVPVASGSVEVFVPWKGDTATYPSNPRTRYTRAETRFLPAPSSSGAATIGNGCLRLGDDTKFSVTSLDVDSAALKLSEFAMATRQLVTRIDQPAISEAALPGLRSSGLTLLQVDRDLAIGNAFTRATALDTSTAQLELFAEDLVRGLRLDIKDLNATDPNRWRSLHQRVGEITAVGRTIAVDQDDEGFISAGTLVEGTQSRTVGQQTGKELFVHEAVAGWTGYSLAARPPGKSIVHVDGQPEETSEDVQDVQNDPLGYVDVASEYRAKPRSLPRLRFGRTYQVRARIADLAGGGVAAESATDATASSKPVKYQRWEPVASPTLLQRTPTTDAEGPEYMVIRSDPRPQAPVSTVAYPGLPTSAGRDYQAVGFRHIVPPKAGFSMVEAHGLLDGAIASTGSTEMLKLMRRESATINSRRFVHLESGGLQDVPGLELRDRPGGQPGPLPVPALPAPFPPLANGQYVLHTQSTAIVPYLPDPMAEGVMLWDAAPLADSVGPKSIHMPWPREDAYAWVQSLRIELSASPDQFEHREYSSTDPRVLRIQLPPGHRMVLNFSSTLYEARLDHMAVKGLFDAMDLTPGQRQTIAIWLREGRHWMVSPSRKLTLVHAVQRPVAPAAFASGAGVTRTNGQHIATLTGNLTCHGESTGHIDLRASWDEIVDDVREPAPRVEARKANIERLQVPYGLSTVPLLRNGTEPKRRLTVLDGCSFALPLALRDNPIVTIPVTQDFGDTRARYVTYDPVSSTRYLENFPPEVIKDRANVEIGGTPKTFVVDASMVPEAPRVAQILPTFSHVFDTVTGAWKRLTGLRIYLERPWCCSGAGERLGIVLKRGSGDASAVEARCVSLWGSDPIWNSNTATPNSLVLSSLAANTTPVLPLGEPDPQDRRVDYTNVAISDGTTNGMLAVDIAGYWPEYNPDRKLWYVDLDFANHDVYFPFVSLALVRYQPHALDGMHVSPVVRADMVQLAPGRAVILGGNTSSYSVSVTGMHAANQRAGQNGLMRAQLQSRAPGSGDLGWSTISGPVLLSASATTGLTTWTGNLPRPAMPSGSEYRIVLLESEVYDADGAGAAGAERVTYVETLTVRPT